MSEASREQIAASIVGGVASGKLVDLISRRVLLRDDPSSPLHKTELSRLKDMVKAVDPGTKLVISDSVNGGMYYPSDNSIVLKPITDRAKREAILSHELGHRITGNTRLGRLSTKLRMIDGSTGGLPNAMSALGGTLGNRVMGVSGAIPSAITLADEVAATVAGAVATRSKGAFRHTIRPTGTYAMRALAPILAYSAFKAFNKE